MYVLNEYMEFGVDTPHIATYNFKLVFHLLFSTIYSTQRIRTTSSSKSLLVINLNMRWVIFEIVLPT